MAQKKYISFSNVFALLIITFNVINLSLEGRLFENFGLFTKNIIYDFEYWRLLTFPFVFNSVENAIVFIPIFLYISPHIEKILTTRLYPIFLFFISFFIGLITIIIFWDKAIILGGMDGVSFFIFTLFALLSHKTNIITEKQLGTFIGISSIIFWATFKYFVAINFGLFALAPSLVAAGSGIVIGLAIFIQIKYIIRNKLIKTRNKIINLQNQKNISRIPNNIIHIIHTEKTVDSTTSPNDTYSQKQNPEQEKEVKFTDNSYENEEQLNKILDKINDFGKNSLSPDEILFLEEYSRNL